MDSAVENTQNNVPLPNPNWAPNTTPTPTTSNAPLPFRQHFLWSACILSFMAYVTAVLYYFLMSPPFRYFVVHRANTLFALPYILSLLVVLLCLAPCSPTPARPQLDAVITSFADCALVLLVLLEWATCLALVLVTLIAVHDHLSYVSPDGLILPTDGGGTTPDDDPSSIPIPPPIAPPPPSDATDPTNVTAGTGDGLTSDGGGPFKPDTGLHSSGDGISHDAVIVLIIPILLIYCLFNCLLHLYSCLEASWRVRNHYADLD